MLRSFRVTNHRSLADPQELRPARGSGSVAVPVTRITGAPAAGKSNLLDALDRMRDAVLHSVTGWDPYAGPPRTPHPSFPERPTEFVAGFVAEGVPYSYGFRLTDADVAAEWLHTHPRGRKRIVFERAGEQVRIGPTFEAARFGLGAVVPLVRPNALLLALAGQLDAEALVPAYRWFAALLEVQRGPLDPDAVALRLGGYLSRSPRGALRLLELTGEAGLGITDLLLPEPDPRYADYLAELDRDLAGGAEQLELCATRPGHAELLLRQHGLTETALARELTALRGARDALFARMAARSGPGVRLAHAGIATPFELADEPASVLALLRLLPAVLDALDTGRVLAVDDLDAALPAATAQRLIGLFRAPETNSRGAQLIFTGREPLAGGGGWTVRRTEHGTSELAAD
ncbi:ATP/GTP-binding protein [Nocardia sp. NPDC057353]|uniref:AAA family ATPase n=1 Tax=Nocardia sp. NPDC057353 TaxID=3346104 RepID=UPI00362E352B